MQIQEHIPLSGYTTLKVGGPAQYLTEVQSVAELREAVRWAHEHTLPLHILGGGSNVLVPDEGVQGLVIRNLITGIEVREVGDMVHLRAGAGEVFDDVVARACAEGWWGLENLSCIPGSVGATPIQNVGAYGVETAELVHTIDVYDTVTDTETTLTPEVCAFGYRDSRFKHDEGKRYVVTHVTYALSKVPAPRLHYRDLAEWQQKRDTEAASALAEIRAAVCAIRSRKFPDWHVVGTAGSFFKNPVISAAEYARLVALYPGLPGHEAGEGMVKVSLGWVLDHVLAVRGVRDGAVGTYEGQALVLVHHGGGSAAEIGAFADGIARRVEDALGITLEREVTRLA